MRKGTTSDCDYIYPPKWEIKKVNVLIKRENLVALTKPLFVIIGIQDGPSRILKETEMDVSHLVLILIGSNVQHHHLRYIHVRDVV